MIKTALAADEPQDPRQALLALQTIEAALADHTVVGASLLNAAQGWVASTLEERTEGALRGLLPYVQANWSTFVAAHGGIPLLECLVTSHLQHELWAVLSTKDPDLMRDHERSHSAIERLFRLVRAADPSTTAAAMTVERDLRNLRAEEREQVWLNDGEWD